MLKKRIFLFLLFASIFSSCKYNLYTEDVIRELRSIQIDPVLSKDGVISEYGPYFEEEFNRLSSKNYTSDRVNVKYALVISIDSKTDDLLIEKNAQVPMIDVIYRAKYKLFNVDKTKILFEESFSSSSPRTITSTDYANYTEIETANIQLTKEFANLVAVKLSLYFKNRHKNEVISK